MTMTVWRGGRGVKAPYETTHVRIPLPIKEQVEELSKAYKDGRLEELTQSEVVPLSEAVDIARQILKKKKSARVSMETLLTSIYGENICL